MNALLNASHACMSRTVREIVRVAECTQTTKGGRSESLSVVCGKIHIPVGNS